MKYIISSIHNCNNCEYNLFCAKKQNGFCADWKGQRENNVPQEFKEIFKKALEENNNEI